jgi:hypothetical protein
MMFKVAYSDKRGIAIKHGIAIKVACKWKESVK